MPEYIGNDSGETGRLSGYLAEFRMALREEIKAVKRQSSSLATQLVNGRRISQVGGGYQYTFNIENTLNLPSDSPGFLHLPEGTSADVTIISVEGMTITVSSNEDLGTFVATASLQTDLTYLIKRLIARIENMSGASNPAGERILGLREFGELFTPLNPDELKCQWLNEGQKKAVVACLRWDTTFIWGPPGTGKTKTIGALVGQLHRKGRSVLLVSHTNTAVDQALWQIGKAISDNELEKGLVVRVGDPQDQRLLSTPNLLIDYHIKRRSSELIEQRDRLEAERHEKTDQIKAMQRDIEIIEWVDSALDDLKNMSEDLKLYQAAEATLTDLTKQKDELISQSDFWHEAKAQAAIMVRKIEEIRESESNLRLQLEKSEHLQQQLNKATIRRASAEQLLAKAKKIDPYRKLMEKLPALSDQETAINGINNQILASRKDVDDLKVRLSQARVLYDTAVLSGKLMRRWKKLPDPDVQLQKVNELQKMVDHHRNQHDDLQIVYSRAKDQLDKIKLLASKLEEYSGVPELANQEIVVQQLQILEKQIAAKISDLIKNIDETKAKLNSHAKAISVFKVKYGKEPETILSHTMTREVILADLNRKIRRSKIACIKQRKKVEPDFHHRLRVLRDWGLTDMKTGFPKEMFTAIQAAIRIAKAEVQNVDTKQLAWAINSHNTRLGAIETELAEIATLLTGVEVSIINEASVVAATLTRAYIRDSIHGRRFDTVILDEASMAPIPALWVAAGLAENNVVIVGDFKQLPPIVMSNEVMAVKWLGRDIFEVANMNGPANRSPHFIKLSIQHRMHPEISKIPNILIYNNMLEDGPGTTDETALTAWYNKDWGHDTSVLLVDTGSLNAWVTSVARGTGSSRLNFLSATICLDLAQIFIKEQRTDLEVGNQKRILIICPYRPHAQLLKLLIGEYGYDSEIEAGTIHTFQGSQADLVMLDLVNDEPHWRVGMFDPKRDETTRRLLNVAITRAKRRLVIVGDFQYVARHSNKAFLGAELIPFLINNYQSVNADAIVSSGLAVRANKAQSLLIGGDVEPKWQRLVVTQANFYDLFKADLTTAKNRVVIFSPFITPNRLGRIEVSLKAAIERGVSVFVVTKPLDDRPKAQKGTYRALEVNLKEWNITIIHKKAMHEKLVFIDDKILWSGSLNPLSHNNTQEIMERRVSAAVVADYTRKMCLEDLLYAYTSGQPCCPECGSEVYAKEGRHTPFYWICGKKDYSISIEKKRNIEDVLSCPKCRGQLDFVMVGDKAVWQCRADKRHSVRLAKKHLNMIKMRELIPGEQLQMLDQKYGIAPQKIIAKPNDSSNQKTLFT